MTPWTRTKMFLRDHPVPPSRTGAFGAWIEACRALGSEGAPAMIDSLENGTEGEQYGAVVCLRTLGYEVWAHGYDEDLHYTVKAPDEEEERNISPRKK